MAAISWALLLWVASTRSPWRRTSLHRRRPHSDPLACSVSPAGLPHFRPNSAHSTQRGADLARRLNVSRSTISKLRI